MRYTLELPFPPSLNDYYKPMYNHKRRFSYITRSKKGKAFRKEVSGLLRVYPTFLGNVHVSTILYPPSAHRRDLDNFTKCLWDSLTHAKIWKDDSQVKSSYCEWGEIVKFGKVYMEITSK